MPRLLRSAGWSASAHYPLAPLLIAAGIATAVAMVRWRLDRFEVRGDSMRPLLEAGERVVIVRTRRPRPGDVVVLADPRTRSRLVVKRVVGVSGRQVTVRGDNPAASTDSRHYGPVERTAVKGRVLYRYHPPARRGLVRPLVP